MRTIKEIREVANACEQVLLKDEGNIIVSDQLGVLDWVLGVNNRIFHTSVYEQLKEKGEIK